jgi:hypothetical protein
MDKRVRAGTDLLLQTEALQKFLLLFSRRSAFRLSMRQPQGNLVLLLPGQLRFLDIGSGLLSVWAFDFYQRWDFTFAGGGACLGFAAAGCGAG